MANLVDKKVIFVDLDDTIIKTNSGKTFPEHLFDFVIKKEVLDKIVEVFPRAKYLFIVSNQNGVGTYISKDEFSLKFNSILRIIQGYLRIKYNETYKIPVEPTVDGDYCIDLNIHRRKPNTGMLERFIDTYSIVSRGFYTKENMIMIGDASDKEKNYSDSDKMCALNFGIDYLDVNDFLKV